MMHTNFKDDSSKFDDFEIFAHICASDPNGPLHQFKNFSILSERHNKQILKVSSKKIDQK